MPNNTVTMPTRASLPRLRKLSCNQWAMLMAHIGVGITVIGITLTTVYSQQRNLSMHPGDKVSVGAYQFTFEGVSKLQGPDYSGEWLAKFPSSRI